MSGTNFLQSWLLTGLFVCFLTAPILLPVLMSFSDSAILAFPPNSFSLRWYEKILGDGEFLASLWLSVKLGLMTTLISLLFGTAAALGLRRMPGVYGSPVRILLMSPMVMPTLVTGIALLQFFNRMNSNAAFTHLLIGHVVVTVPYVVRTVTASIQQMVPGIEDAARTLGANPLSCFWYITLPQIKPGILVGGIFVFILSFDNYPVSMWLADAQNMPLPLTAYRYIQRFFDPTVAAISTIMIVISLIAVVAMERVAGLQNAWSR
jgi:putative spermidine/putrescine transport system permease protein